MRCKKHISDLSSVVGVCATCLADKLFALVEAQQQRRNSNADSSGIVSPYASRRHGLPDYRFHATPQVGPRGELILGEEYTNKKKNSKFSLFYDLFRSKSGNLVSDSDPRVSNSDDSSNTTRSWFSTILAGRRGKKNRSLSLDEAHYSSPAWKQTPRRTPARRPSEMAFCLSPLVWASPKDMVYTGGEITSPAKSRFHNATSFCKNRSRKLADFGRFRHNH